MRVLNILRLLLTVMLLIFSVSLLARKTTKKQSQEEYQLQLIKEKVKAYQPQLTRIYTRESAIFAQGGMLKITLYIDEKGKVVDTEVKVASGKFTSSLIKSMRAKMMEWKFVNKTKMIYTFSMRLSKT